MHHLDEMKLALSLSVVERLLAQRQISVCDFRCLNAETKQYVRRIFLANARVQFMWKCSRNGDNEEPAHDSAAPMIPRV